MLEAVPHDAVRHSSDTGQVAGLGLGHHSGRVFERVIHLQRRDHDVRAVHLVFVNADELLVVGRIAGELADRFLAAGDMDGVPRRIEREFEAPRLPLFLGIGNRNTLKLETLVVHLHVLSPQNARRRGHAGFGRGE